MFQPRYTLKQPDSFPNQLWIRDITGRKDAENEGGWTTEALSGSTLTVAIRHADSGKVVAGPYSLLAGDVLAQDQAIPFTEPDGLYDLEVKIESIVNPIPLYTYSLTNLLLDPAHQLLVGVGGDVSGAATVNITSAAVRTGQYVNWTSGSTPQTYIYWSIKNASGQIIRSGTFTEGEGSVVALTNAFAGQWSYRFLIDRYLVCQLDSIASRLTYNQDDTFAPTPKELEALHGWGFAYFRHQQLVKHLTQYAVADADSQLQNIARMAYRLERLIPKTFCNGL